VKLFSTIQNAEITHNTGTMIFMVVTQNHGFRERQLNIAIADKLTHCRLTPSV